jgi:hypothetical protein
MELFLNEFVPELNTKNLGASISFLNIAHKTLSAKRFRKYRILTIVIAAVFYFWTQQRRKGLAKTPEVVNTIWKTTLSTFWWSNKRLQMVSDLRVTAVEN